MCLDVKWSKEATQRWLDKQPEYIVAYKVVMISNGCYRYRNALYPPCVSNYFCKEYKRKNRISAETESKLPYATSHSNIKDYTPYYHLFKTEAAANKMRRWWNGYKKKAIKCLIPKKDVTCMGMQGGYMVIVTKSFEFDEQEYEAAKKQ